LIGVSGVGSPPAWEARKVGARGCWGLWKPHYQSSNRLLGEEDIGSRNSREKLRKKSQGRRPSGILNVNDIVGFFGLVGRENGSGAQGEKKGQGEEKI